jgi:hypothetical protein
LSQKEKRRRKYLTEKYSYEGIEEQNLHKTLL